MGKLSERMAKLLGIKNDFKSALATQGVDVGERPFREYPSLVDGLRSKIAVTSVSIAELSGQTVEWEGGGERKLLTLGSVLPADATADVLNFLDEPMVKWTSSNNTVVEIVSEVGTDGKIKTYAVPIDEGKATITVTVGGKSDSFTASVSPAGAIAKAIIAAKRGEPLAIGTKLEDYVDGVLNSLLIAHYGTAKLSDGTTHNGLYCFREFAQPAAQAFGPNVDYTTSTIHNLLNGELLEKCSEDFKKYVAEIAVPYYKNGSTLVDVNAKQFLMSETEIMGVNGNNNTKVEGVAWDLWKQRTGLTSPSSSNNNGRIMKDKDGNTVWWWLRSWYSSSYVCYVYTTGYTTNYGTPSYTNGVVPACFFPID